MTAWLAKFEGMLLDRDLSSISSGLLRSQLSSFSRALSTAAVASSSPSSVAGGLVGYEARIWFVCFEVRATPVARKRASLLRDGRRGMAAE